MKTSSSENWVEIGGKEIVLLYTASKNIFTNSVDFFPHKLIQNEQIRFKEILLPYKSTPY